ncbi:hypothetical protein [Lentibacillus daqui]|nr:hypothetical protein [Lentibacillus daqui]
MVDTKGPGGVCPVFLKDGKWVLTFLWWESIIDFAVERDTAK